MRLTFARLLTVCGLGVALAAANAHAQLPLDRLTAPPGFAIELFARVPGARSLAVAERGARIYDGADEVHIDAVARRILRAHGMEGR